MSDSKKHIGKDAEHNKKKSVEELPQPLDKDYAHYPPTSAEQVIKPLTKELKATEAPNTENNTGATKVSSSATPQQGNGLSAQREKIVNESKKIVNSTDESYSDGSGGAFEATEQVNE